MTAEKDAKKSNGFIQALILLALIVFTLISIQARSVKRDYGGQAAQSNSSSSSSSSTSQTQSVVYEIEGEGVDAVSLTWENDTGGTNQGDYLLPIRLTFRNFNSGDFVYISAQIIQPTSGAGTITCEIKAGTYGTQVIARAQASGFASIATCSDLLP